MLVDTIIVGGGLAGLFVAEQLAAAKVNVVVLEKYPAWGGRAATFREGALQYEIGAGRIFNKHARVAALVERFKLTKYPISTATTFENPNTPNMFLDLFTPLANVISKLPPDVLAKHTIAELVPENYAHLLKMYPYTAELHMLRADRALKLFGAGAPMAAKGAADYYGIVEGIDSLGEGLKAAATAAGADLRNRHRVHDIKQIHKNLFEVTGDFGKKAEAKPFTYRARRVIIATCRCSLSDFSVLKDTPLLKQIGTSALMRIYAVYPQTSGTVWFHGMPKVVTAGPLRYIIPIDQTKGLIMISYTDGEDTNYWRRFSDKDLQEAIQTEVRKQFPTKTIPEPIYLKRHDWPSGCSYWLPGDYDVETAIEEAMNPISGIYVVGESVSIEQTWMEGALESAERLVKILT